MEQTLGKRIVAHRKGMGLTQDQLAEKLGVTAQAVSKWENDQSCPDITMLPRLAEIFGTTTDALLGKETVHEGKIVTEKEAPRKEKSHWEFHWDGGRKGGFTSAIFVLLLGALLLISRALHWNVTLWDIAWPSAMLVFGLSYMMGRVRFSNLVCALLGGYFLIDNLGILPAAFNEDLIFPAMIVIFGLSLLLDALRKPKKKGFHIHKQGSLDHKTQKHFSQENARFEANLSFGDATHTITLPQLQSGSANVSFGEMEIDLTGCGQIADGCHLEIGVSFGELRLRVPNTYRVEANTGASFGDISFHGHPQENVQGTIYLDGGVSFGELEIHYI